MADDLPELDVRDGDEWRAWLEAHHAVSPGIWLVFHKRHTGRETVSYEAAVCQALCFGWIDSLVRRLDDDRYVRKFTPRKPRSNWSATNRRRWLGLRSEGLLAAAGLATAPADLIPSPAQVVPELPDYIAAAFRAEPQAWRFFQALAPTHRRRFVTWIHTAKRPATRQRRIRESLALLAAGRKLGLK